MALQGNFIWALKQHIDKQWMAGYKDLPSREKLMTMMALPEKVAISRAINAKV